jgi:hypothetical protein
MDFVFTIPSAPATFVFDVANITIGGGGDAGGTINVYLDGVLQSSTSSTDLDAETVNILWT